MKNRTIQQDFWLEITGLAVLLCFCGVLMTRAVFLARAGAVAKVDEAVYADNFDEIPDGGDGMEDMRAVLEHLIEVENPGRDPEAVGDLHLTDRAYGILQIRRPYIEDVNRIAGTGYTVQDMRDPELARWAATIYLGHYGARYTRITGKEPTLEVYARIHNGGPDGWRKDSTNQYVRKMTAKGE